MHQAAFDYVARFATDRDMRGVDIGGRDVNGTTRHLFPGTSWWVIDAQEGGPEVDEVADGAEFTPDWPVDIVLCTEVFEHTPNWRDIVDNIHRILIPGGMTVLTMAGPGRAPHGVHADDPIQPGYYRNVSADELKEALTDAGFHHVEVDSLGEDTRAMAIR